MQCGTRYDLGKKDNCGKNGEVQIMSVVLLIVLCQWCILSFDKCAMVR